MKNPVHLAILFIVLIGSDLVIGFGSHFLGATGGDFSVESIGTYFMTTEPLHWVLVLAIATVVCVVVYFLGD